MKAYFNTILKQSCDYHTLTRLNVFESLISCLNYMRFFCHFLMFLKIRHLLSRTPTSMKFFSCLSHFVSACFMNAKQWQEKNVCACSLELSNMLFSSFLLVFCRSKCKTCKVYFIGLWSTGRLNHFN